MKVIQRLIHKCRCNVIILTVTFISVIFIGVYLLHYVNLIEAVIFWLFSIIGAIFLIFFSSLRVGKPKKNLKYHFKKSQKQPQLKTALTGLSAGFATTLTEDEICLELSRRLNEIQGYEYIEVYLYDENHVNRILRACVGGLGTPNALILAPGEGLS